MRNAAVLCLIVLTGCRPAAPPSSPSAAPAILDARATDAPILQPLPVQQRQVYGETVTGRFVSLVDFEGAAGAQGQSADPGRDQVRLFGINPLGSGGLRHVVNITRTGAGAMEVVLPADGTLVFRLPYIHDFRPYTLLSLAVYSPVVRDDLVVTLTSPTATWRAPTRLLTPGWNTVLIDLARLRRSQRFALRSVRTIELHFPWAREPVTFHLDDVMLIHNVRRIQGTPEGIVLRKTGLDYSFTLPGRGGPILLAQDEDGLWRFGRHQIRVELTPATEPSDAGSGDLRAMGRRRVGAVRVLEVNPLRLRIANVWYFPPRPGRWVDMDVRQIRWDHTFYADGRWITHVTLNNAGGRELTAVRLTAPAAVAWSTGSVGRALHVDDFLGPVGVWACLAAPDGDEGEAFRANFAHPPASRIQLGRRTPPAAGDANHDGFDESQGCYVARAVGGNCRIQLTRGPTPLLRPVVRIVGPWQGTVAANCAGLLLRPVVKLPDGVLVLVPETLTAPAVVEFAGTVGLLDE